MGDGPNMDRARVIPAVDNTSADNFASERMGAPLVKVAYGDPPGMPSCNEIMTTMHQLDVHGPNLLGKMDAFIGGTLAKNGVTFQQLEQMRLSNQFSPADKAAIHILEEEFGKATAGRDPNTAHMTMRDLETQFITDAVKQNCRAPGQ